jgi:hypothetical protein
MPVTHPCRVVLPETCPIAAQLVKTKEKAAAHSCAAAVSACVGGGARHEMK